MRLAVFLPFRVRESSAAEAASATSAEFMCSRRALHTLPIASSSDAILTLFSEAKMNSIWLFTASLMESF